MWRSWARTPSNTDINAKRSGKPLLFAARQRTAVDRGERLLYDNLISRGILVKADTMGGLKINTDAAPFQK